MAHRYSYQFDPDDNGTAAQVCRLAGTRGGKVLELGCAAGTMTQVLSRHYGCEVTGVECDVLAAKVAKPYCARVIMADLNDPLWISAISSERFDTVVAADVLEHLRDPATCLRQVRNILTTDGQVVISVPNIAHSGVLAALFNNDFPYRDTGLLDRTHTHFFTSRTLECMLTQTGFAVEAMLPINAGRWHEEFRRFWEKLPRPIVDWLATNPAGAAYQIIVRAVPTTAELSYIDDISMSNREWLEQWPSTTDLGRNEQGDAGLHSRIASLMVERDEALARLAAIEQSRAWRFWKLYRWLRGQTRLGSS